MRMREKFLCKFNFSPLLIESNNFFLWVMAFPNTRSNFFRHHLIHVQWMDIFELSKVLFPLHKLNIKPLPLPGAKVKLTYKNFRHFSITLYQKNKLYGSRVKLKSHKNIRKLCEWIKTMRISIKSSSRVFRKMMAVREFIERKTLSLL